MARAEMPIEALLLAWNWKKQLSHNERQRKECTTTTKILTSSCWSVSETFDNVASSSIFSIALLRSHPSRKYLSPKRRVSPCILTMLSWPAMLRFRGSCVIGLGKNLQVGVVAPLWVYALTSFASIILLASPNSLPMTASGMERKKAPNSMMKIATKRDVGSCGTWSPYPTVVILEGGTHRCAKYT